MGPQYHQCFVVAKARTNPWRSSSSTVIPNDAKIPQWKFPNPCGLPKKSTLPWYRRVGKTVMRLPLLSFQLLPVALKMKLNRSRKSWRKRTTTTIIITRIDVCGDEQLMSLSLAVGGKRPPRLCPPPPTTNRRRLLSC